MVGTQAHLDYQTPHEFVEDLTKELTTEARISSSYWWEIHRQVTLLIQVVLQRVF